MRKRINRVVLFCLLLGICSCVASLKDQESTRMRSDSLGADALLQLQLDKMELDEAELKAFESMALEKVRDFYELSDLLSSDNQTEEVQEVAREELQRLFTPEGVIISDQDTLTVDRYIQLLRDEQVPLSLPSDLHFTESFYFYDGRYEGSIAIQENALARCQLLRQEKVFGGSSQTTWEVLLVEVIL